MELADDGAAIQQQLDFGHERSLSSIIDTRSVRPTIRPHPRSDQERGTERYRPPRSTAAALQHGTAEAKCGIDDGDVGHRLGEVTEQATRRDVVLLG